MKPVSLFIRWFLGFFLIALLCIQFKGFPIENELTQKTRQALTNNGFESVTSIANGQIITLTGFTQSHQDHLRAESITKAVDGVTTVNNQLTITIKRAIQQVPPTPAQMPLPNAFKPIAPQRLKAPEAPVTPIAPKMPEAPEKPEALIAPVAPVAPFQH